MNTIRGFTLIEILVVMFIIGIIVTFTMLAFGDFGLSRKVDLECERIVQTAELLRQRAIIESRVYAAEFDKSTYAFYRYQPPQNKKKGQWLKISDERVLRPHTLPSSIHMKVVSNSKKILFLTSGGITPFQLTLSLKQPVCRIAGLAQGSIKRVAHGKS